MRGDLVTVAMPGKFGKPRPALVIQSDQFDEHPSVTLLPVTSTLVTVPLLRITLEPSEENGLRKISQVMVDKAITVKRDKVGTAFGRIDPKVSLEVERCLALFFWHCDVNHCAS